MPWLFAAAFNLSVQEFVRQAMLPLAFACVAAGALVLVDPAAARSVVIALCLPTVLWNSLMLMGSWDLGHAFTAFALIGAASVGAWIGYVARRKGTGD